MVINSDGTQLGVMNKSDAIAAARSVGLDLILVSGNSDPQVAKIGDFGKYKYAIQRKSSSNSGGTKKMKEIKLNVSVGERDLNIKISKASEFAISGHQVRFVIKMHGRELMHKDVAMRLAKDIVAKMTLYSKLHEEPTCTGGTVSMMFIPDRTKKLQLDE